MICLLNERPTGIVKNQAALAVDLDLCHCPELIFLWIFIAGVVPPSAGVRRRDEGSRLRLGVEADSRQNNAFLWT